MFNLGRNEEEETKRFWDSVEREAGMPVLEYALGQYISGYDDREGPVWGLLYLTAETLYFRHFPSSNWFSAGLYRITRSCLLVIRGFPGIRAQ